MFRDKKKAVVTSLVAIVLCFSLLVSVTFAWFTDTASTGVNTIKSGTLDVGFLMEDESGAFVDAENKTLDFKTTDDREKILWEPGCTYELPALKVVNYGNLAFKYKVEIGSFAGSALLAEVLEITVNGAALLDGEGNAVTLAEIMQDPDGVAYGILLPKDASMELVTDTAHQKLATIGETAAYTIGFHMQETAGNDYQKLVIEKLAFTVTATQYTYESDSFDNLYDVDAEGAPIPTPDPNPNPTPEPTPDPDERPAPPVFDEAGEHQATVGEMKFNSLKDAIEWAWEDEIVKVESALGGHPTIVIGEGQKVTLDLNGNAIEFAKDANVEIKGGSLTLVGTGTLDTQDEPAVEIFSLANADGRSALTVGENVTLYGECGILVVDGGKNYDMTITVNGKILNRSHNGNSIEIPATSVNPEKCPVIVLGPTADIYGGSDNIGVVDAGVPLKLLGYAKTTVNGATLTSRFTVIDIRAGELDVQNATLNGYTEWIHDTNGEQNDPNWFWHESGIAVSQENETLRVSVTLSDSKVHAKIGVRISNPKKFAGFAEMVSVKVTNCTITDMGGAYCSDILLDAGKVTANGVVYSLSDENKVYADGKDAGFGGRGFNISKT